MELINISDGIDLVVENGFIRVVIGGEDVRVESTYLFKRALDQADLIAMEQTQQIARHSGPCMARLLHEDESVMPCVLQKTHLLDDSDHEDAHGHRAPVPVRQSTIREVKAIQDARDAGLIK